MEKKFKIIKGATTAPKGYVWVNNGKSLFSDDYKQWLIKESEVK